ncbi:MAG: response regulator [Spirochaetales bacterium]|nr:response regulator [Spirochaetales bacterium]
MIKLVIIDDEKWIRKLIIKILPFNKFPIKVVGEAEDGVEGLELVTNLNPDIILTDIRMPLLSGLELIKEISSKSPDSQIIVISGYDNFDYAHKAIKYGVIDFLLKPIEELELEGAISKAIKNLRKKDKLNETKLLEKKVKRLSNIAIDIEHFEYPDTSYSDKIKKSIVYIYENFREPISLNHVSDAVLMNSSYFSELFKKEVGMGFNQFLINIRFNEAKKLLKDNTDLTIGDISSIVGFQDSNYFSRLFKKKFNCTPIEFRNNY